MGLALVFWQLPTPKLSSTPRPCSVGQWVWAPPLSLHHPRQQLSKPGRVGREHPAGSIPSSGEGSLLARTLHTPLPWALSSGSSVRGRHWGGQRGPPGSHRRLDSWVPPSPRPETPEAELALDEAVWEIFRKVSLPQKNLSTRVVSRGLAGGGWSEKRQALCVWGSDCQGSRPAQVAAWGPERGWQTDWRKCSHLGLLEDSLTWARMGLGLWW